MSFELPPEYYVPNRASLLELYEGFTRDGWLPKAETEAAYWKENLAEFGVLGEPKHGWEDLALDIRLANLALPDPIDQSGMGRADLARKFESLAEQMKQIRGELTGFSWNNDVLAVTLRDTDKFQSHLPDLNKLEQSLRRTGRELAKWKQRPRWREAHQRKRRMELAVLLSRAFERHFEESALPCGGSHVRPLSEANDWTRFYQAVAFAFFRERETPDRQAVLWEATKPKIVEYEPRVSDNPDSLKTRLSDSASK